MVFIMLEVSEPTLCPGAGLSIQHRSLLTGVLGGQTIAANAWASSNRGDKSEVASVGRKEPFVTMGVLGSDSNMRFSLVRPHVVSLQRPGWGNYQGEIR